MVNYGETLRGVADDLQYRFMIRRRFCWILVSALLAQAVAPAGGAELDQTTRSTVNLLRSCMSARKDGEHLRMVRALRQLGDPELQPFFKNLVYGNDEILRAHGLLGLAECSPEKRIDTLRLTTSEVPALQRRVISFAMDEDLLGQDQAEQLMHSRGLDPTVRVVAASFLLMNGEVPDVDFLRESMSSDNIGLAGLSAMLLLQLGDDEALIRLKQLGLPQPADEQEDQRVAQRRARAQRQLRDRVRAQLLRTAFQSKFDRVASWALQISVEEEADDVLKRLGLLVALRFGAPEAVDVWRQQYEAASRRVDRVRIALVALNASHWIDPDVFDPLIGSDDRILHLAGKAGAAVASGKNIVEAVLEAIELNNEQINNWALDYAVELASDENAQAILLGLILAFEGDPLGQAQRLRHSIDATTAMSNEHPQAARTLLRPLLADASTDTKLVRGILIGLVKSDASDPYPILDGLVPFDDSRAANLVLLITAKHGHDLTDSQLRDLALLVRGGGRMSRHFRIQAAWAYLKRTGNTGVALAKALSP